jgi:tetratricopeptide (TPR) repeat protein
MSRRAIVLVGLALALGAGCKRREQPRTPPAPPPTSAAARGAREKPRPPTADEKKRYREALRRGRGLDRQGDLAGAIQAFRDALGAIPDDAAALSELGWAAYRAKDLKTAEEATRKAVDRAGETRLRAASLYNLGRVLEDRADKAGAVEAYARSLELRQSRPVRERLAKLDPAAAARAEIFGVHPLIGPLAGGMEAFCKRPENRCDAMGDGEDKPEQGCEAVDVKVTGALAPPWQEVAVWSVSCTLRDDSDVGYHLAVRTARGWYVYAGLGTGGEGRRHGQELKVAALELRDVVPGGAPELVVRWSETQSSYSGGSNRSWDSEYDYLLVAGFGASGAPSATGKVPLAVTHETTRMFDEDEQKEGEGEDTSDLGKTSIIMDFAFTADGQLELKGPTKVEGKPEEDLGRYAGRHPLVFP